jgi:tRNA1(Val) A37 N6-methylase TrmN6
MFNTSICCIKWLMDDEFTIDSLLGERVILKQSRTGYRVAIDPVLLASCIAVKSGDHVLDLGCGSGAASLCLAMRVQGITIDGLEKMPQMLELAAHNITANRFDDRINIVKGDVTNPPPEIMNTSYDHVMSNPPYMLAGSGNAPPDPVKSAAMVESTADLASWVTLAWQVLRPKGTLSLVHRTDRLSDILNCLDKKFGDIVIYPLWPDAPRAQASKRVLVRAIKGVKTPLRLLPGMALHDVEGGYTQAALAILQDGKSLNIDL